MNREGAKMRSRRTVLPPCSPAVAKASAQASCQHPPLHPISFACQYMISWANLGACYRSSMTKTRSEEAVTRPFGPAWVCQCRRYRMNPSLKCAL